MIIRQALTDFYNLLDKLSKDPNNNFVLVSTQGVLKPADWANELHPNPDGFKLFAGKFLGALQHHFPGRI